MKKALPYFISESPFPICLLMQVLLMTLLHISTIYVRYSMQLSSSCMRCVDDNCFLCYHHSTHRHCSCGKDIATPGTDLVLAKSTLCFQHTGCLLRVNFIHHIQWNLRKRTPPITETSIMRTRVQGPELYSIMLQLL